MNGQLETAAQIRGNDHEIEEQNAAGKPRTALILFASETGTSEDAAQSLGRLFERLRFDVEVKSMDAARLVRHVCPMSSHITFGSFLLFLSIIRSPRLVLQVHCWSLSPRPLLDGILISS